MQIVGYITCVTIAALAGIAGVIAFPLAAGLSESQGTCGSNQLAYYSCENRHCLEFLKPLVSGSRRKVMASFWNRNGLSPNPAPFVPKYIIKG